MIDMIKKLRQIAITGKGTKQEIQTLTKQATAELLTTAENINREWSTEPLPEEKPFRIQNGTKKPIMANNMVDMFEGATNRMHTTHDRKEFVNMRNGALYYIQALNQLALEKIGEITIPEYNWRCTLEL